MNKINMITKQGTIEFLEKMKKGIEEDIMIVKDLEEHKVLDYMLEQSNCMTNKLGMKLGIKK